MVELETGRGQRAVSADDGGAIPDGGADDGGHPAGPACGALAALRDAVPAEYLTTPSGTQDRDLGFGLLIQLSRALDLNASLIASGEGDADGNGTAAAAAARHATEEAQVALEGAMGALRAIGPRNGLEGMLAVQMVSAHAAAMDFTAQARDRRQTAYARSTYMRQAARLMQMFTRQMEALSRHRGEAVGGVNVGRVNVASGGQAIVGPVRQRRTGTNGDEE